ncbi:unnamed protein product [Notodromas monacha]|uniref:Uncharacterized protein n=1 Tax=Notodromas monacha TaxID=399045 RepID=A0A7R9BTQ0_9CRUS|nr:unnamed protein product [Notodromas monacha]CAG0921564.1 unnamed protein product [Notodromas monacha]
MQKCLSVFHTNGSLTSDLQWELAHCKLNKRFNETDNKKSCLKQRHIHKLSNQFLFFGDSTVRAKAIALAKFFNIFQKPCSTENCDFSMVPKLHWEDEASSTKIDFLMNPYFNPYLESLQVLSKYEDKVVIWSSWAMFFQQLESKGLGNIMPDGRHVKEEFQLPGMQPLLNFLCNPVDPRAHSFEVQGKLQKIQWDSQFSEPPDSGALLKCGAPSIAGPGAAAPLTPP